MAKHDDLESLVSNFVAQLRGVIRQQALAAIQDSLAGNGTRVKIATNGSSGRAKGQKREPHDLEALAAKFVGFVAKHPDLRIEQINKQLGTTTKDLQLPIRKLIAEGQIKAKGAKRSTTYVVGKRHK